MPGRALGLEPGERLAQLAAAGRAGAVGLEGVRVVEAVAGVAVGHGQRSSARRVRGPTAATRLGTGRSDELGRRRSAAVDQRLDVDAGAHAEVVEHGDELLGGQVAGRAGGERRAAQAADRRVEPVDAELQRGVGVTRARCRGSRGGAARRRCPPRRATSSMRRGVAMPVVSAQVIAAQPTSRSRCASRATAAGRDVALVGRAEGAAQHGVDRDRRRRSRRSARRRPADSSIDMWTLRWL